MRAIAVLAAAVAVAPAASCGSSSESAVAELAAATGQVEGAERDAPESWQADRPGARYRRGDGIRTGPASSARVTMLRGGGALRMGARSLVRFGQSDGTHRIALETGAAEIEAGDAELVVDTARGPARIGAGARVRLTRTGGETRLEVVVGTARIERSGAEPVALAAGDELAIAGDGTLRRGGPVDAGTADAAPPSPPAAELDAGGAAAAEPAKAADGPTLRGRPVTIEPSPTAVDVALPAGETSTVHLARPPLSVRLSVAGACDGPAVVQVARGGKRRYYRGRGAAALPLAAGRNRYRVYCEADGALRPTDRRGTVRVVRDSGRRRVKTRAPKNTVEADGRTYRLLYQNRKPTITFVWPKAPAGDGYQLVLTSKRGTSRSYRAKAPRYTLRSGKLAEGRYRFRFRGPGGATSREGTLVLDFDNAAPAAQLERASFGKGGVEVRGLATVGSKVSIGGVDLPVDDHYRFRARVAAPAGQRAIAVKIVRSSGAVHYYVRRAP